jgi:hypothetical protein
MVVGSGAGPLAIAVFLALMFVAGYLYFYLIDMWRIRRERHREP